MIFEEYLKYKSVWSIYIRFVIAFSLLFLLVNFLLIIFNPELSNLLTTFWLGGLLVGLLAIVLFSIYNFFNPLSKDFLSELIKEIEAFTPSQKWFNEQGYQGELQGWLKRKFPDSKVEVQRGSSRPDLILKNIAIEVKGPTTAEQLNTIASKCMRYSKHFPEGLIVVLFDIKVGDRYYAEWFSSLKDQFPEVIVIKK
ncbi:MAG: hypothetical protein ABIH20_02375 [Candidatus Diapherotrites archaeon]